MLHNCMKASWAGARCCPATCAMQCLRAVPPGARAVSWTGRVHLILGARATQEGLGFFHYVITYPYRTSTALPLLAAVVPEMPLYMNLGWVQRSPYPCPVACFC